MNPHLWNRRVDQQQPTQGEQRNASDCQNPVRNKFCLRCEKGKSSQDQNQGGPARWQKVQGERRHQNEDHANGPRNDRSRMIELYVERKRANGQNQKRDIRIHQNV